MDVSIYKSSEQVKGAIATLSSLGLPIPEELNKRLIELEQQERESESSRQHEDVHVNSATPIYDTLKANAVFKPNAEKTQCIESTVAQLMEEGPDAEKPGLLLGKIQCGKTDTYENIIGLAFDKGIDIAIVLTKGTTALAEQTKKRMEKDYRFFSDDNELIDRPIIRIHDIMEIKSNLKAAHVEGCKTVIICKKQADNLKYLIELFKNKDFLQNKKVLIVDDEADFASRNYQSVHFSPELDESGNPVGHEADSKLAKISQQIDDFRKIPAFCRYLQVTATPYCLYLQPNGELSINNKNILPFRPRFTSLVPVHDAYIGGEQYFVESKDENSMYSHLFHPIDKVCIDVMGGEDMKHYSEININSANLFGLTSALVSYVMATAIRRIQQLEKGYNYKSSALIHVYINKDCHELEKGIVDKILKGLQKHFLDGEVSYPVIKAFDDSYKDFEDSNKKGRGANLLSEDFPSEEAVKDEMKVLLKKENCNVQVVNSNEGVNALLDRKTGELKLVSPLNIFIGGSILDRGITIKNMLCFFYGRSPKSFQQDTVLQHMRFYGARSKADMAVTRLYTTEEIHNAMSRMNELDQQLRDWFIAGKDQTEPNAVFVGYDPDIKPCAPQKIKVSNALTIKPQRRYVPSGFWTGNKSEIADTINRIDSLIKGSPYYAQKDEDGFFEIDKDRVFEIIRLIQTTYVYDGDHCNIDKKNDLQELLCAVQYSADKSGGKMWALHREGRTMKRIRQNGTFIDAPDSGHNDTIPSRIKAIDAPVIMFIRNDGNSEIVDGVNNGWNDTPFYWPVLMTQQNLNPVVYTLEQRRRKKTVFDIDLRNFLGDIDPKDVLILPFKGNLTERFGEIGTEFAVGEMVEHRAIKKTTAGHYLVRNDSGKWAINENAQIDESNFHGVYTYNKGTFPFVLKPYKYMLLIQGRVASGNVNMMLIELYSTKQWIKDPYIEIDEEGNLLSCEFDSGKQPEVLYHITDTVYDKDGNELEYANKNVCQWLIGFTLKKVLKVQTYQLAPEQAESDEMSRLEEGDDSVIQDFFPDVVNTAHENSRIFGSMSADDMNDAIMNSI